MLAQAQTNETDRRDAIGRILDQDREFLVGDLDRDRVIDQWMATGMVPEEIDEWIDAGAWNPDAAMTLRNAGISPEQAATETCYGTYGGWSKRSIARGVSDSTLSVEDALVELRHVTLSADHIDDELGLVNGYDLKAGCAGKRLGTVLVKDGKLAVSIQFGLMTFAQEGEFETVAALNEFLRECTGRTLTEDAHRDCDEMMDSLRAEA